MEKHWHTYWINPGDAGLATRVDWTLPEGYQAGGIQCRRRCASKPRAARSSTVTRTKFCCSRRSRRRGSAGGSKCAVESACSWLVCAEVCIPGEADLTAATNVAKLGAAPSADPHWTQLFAAARQQLPTTVSDWQFQAETTADGYNLIAKPLRADAVWPAGKLFFFSADPVIIESSAEQPIQADGKGHIISLTKSAFAADAPQRLRGVLAAAGGWGGGLPSIVVDAAVGPGAGTVAASGNRRAAKRVERAGEFRLPRGFLGLGVAGRLDLESHALCLPGDRTEDRGIRQSIGRGPQESHFARTGVHRRRTGVVLGACRSARGAARRRRPARLGIPIAIPRLCVCPGGGDAGIRAQLERGV